MKLLDQILAVNDTGELALALCVLAVAMLVLAVAPRLVARGCGERWHGVPAALARSMHVWLLFPLALYMAALPLDLPARVDRVLALIAMMGMLGQGGVSLDRLLSLWLDSRFKAARERDPEGATTLRLIGFAARAGAWVLVTLLALDQLGFDVTALVAGLGIGGVAIALAVQNVLGDLFACAAIALDKPFAVGDFIVVDSFRGTVDNVGLKTTRLRSLDGEMLVFSNADLLRSRVRNFKRMRDRRVQFALGVTYDTPVDKLRAIPRWLRQTIQGQAGTRFDRAHFKSYGESSLDFEAVYFVLDPDYNTYMDVQQAINLAIFERFAAEGVDFAFPTRTLVFPRHPPSGATAQAGPRTRAVVPS